MRLFKILTIAGIALSLTGCLKSPDYQKIVAIPDAAWKSAYMPEFRIDIRDTGIYYKTYLLIRHTNNYAYSNIWLNVWVKGPQDSTFQHTRIEVPLANLQGRWLGNGMGELFEQRRMLVLDLNEVPLTDELVAYAESGIRQMFRQKGIYTIRFEQNMRDVALPEVLQVGLRVEKGGERKPFVPKATQPVSADSSLVL